MNEQYELTDKNQPRPRTPEWFVKAMEHIGHDTGVQLRLVWGPEMEGIRWGSRVKLYATPHVYAKHIGWFKARYVPDGQGGEKLKHESYHPVSEFKDFSPEGAYILPTGQWLLPDMKYWHVAHPRWIVEGRVDDRERANHEAVRYEWDPDTHEMIDTLGPWPEEGRWINMYVVAQHVIVCCEQANAEHRLCYGIGRDPNENDLIYVRECLQRFLAEPKLPEPGSQEWNRRYGQATKAAYAQHREAERHQKEHYREIMGSALAPTLGKAMTLDTTLPGRVDLAPSSKVDRFQQAARNYMLELERKGDIHDGHSS